MALLLTFTEPANVPTAAVGELRPARRSADAPQPPAAAA